MSSIKKFWNDLQKSGFYRVLNFISKSAGIGLLITLVIFVLEWGQSEKQDRETQQNFDATLSELNHIQQSLSTRFLGIFPGYISDICSLFHNIGQGDTVIVFEDVLYYGIKSRPEEFRRYNYQLLKHALEGGYVLVACYNYEIDSTQGKPVWENVFHKMIVESRIDAELIAKMSKERRQLRRNDMSRRTWSEMRTMDSTLCEKYFEMGKRKNMERFQRDITGYLDPALIASVDTTGSNDTIIVLIDAMCMAIDSLKHACLDKELSKLTFADYERMYRGMSEIIARTYINCGIEMLPMNDYMTMSCWLVKPNRQNYQRTSEAILAFPSKYSTDEIGFYSQDEAFSNYITTMQQGVKDDNTNRSTHND